MHRFKRFTPIRIIMFIIILLWCLSLLFPIEWAFLASFKQKKEYILDKLAFPSSFSLVNYVKAYNVLSAGGKSVPAMIFNSLWISVGGILLSLAVSACTAYILAMFKFPGRGLLYSIAIVTMMIPIVGNLPAVYKMYYSLHIYDSPFILVASAGGFGFNFLILYACFRGVSWSYAEVAYMEGANHFTVFFKIMLPQITGVLAALFVSAFIGSWNDYTSSILFYPSYITLASGLYLYQEEAKRTIDYPMLFAAVIMCAVPSIVLFLCFQKKLLELNMGGGLKG